VWSQAWLPALLAQPLVRQLAAMAVERLSS
jgi:hypothetical protein